MQNFEIQGFGDSAFQSARDGAIPALPDVLYTDNGIDFTSQQSEIREM